MSQPTAHEPSPDLFPGLQTDSRSQVPVLPTPPDFHCPHCRAHTPFNLYFAPAEALEPQVRADFDKASRALRAQHFHHQDFHCRGCGRAVRVVYGAFEFAMSSYLYIPRQVLIGPPRQ
jgi:hypothetical protein